jgi:DNA processing protein
LEDINTREIRSTTDVQVEEPGDAAILALLLSRARSAWRIADKACLNRLRHGEGKFSERLGASGFLESMPALKREFESGEVRARLQKELADWSAGGIRIVTIFGERYPELLRAIYDPPWLLFFKGANLRALSRRPMVAVVGARSARPASIGMASELAEELARAGACVVSGLALGIDAAAHRGALRSARAAATIGILGNGLDSVYPASNFNLAREMIEADGLLVSQFEPGERPYPSNFLARNRIIAGLCKAVIVVQAAERSGSMVTARYALEEGRDVLALPGAVGDDSFRGSNRLIKEGAYLLSELKEIYEFLPELEACESSEAVDAKFNLSDTGRKMIELIADAGKLHFDRLRAELPAHADFSVELVKLETEGIVERLPGNYLALIERWSG